MSGVSLHLIQLAGGKGLRAGGDIPKQFRSTGRGLLFGISVRTFLGIDPTVGHLRSLTLTAGPRWSETIVQELSDQPLLDAALQIAAPGATRTASTWNALQMIDRCFAPRCDDLVAVHDAARPFASLELLESLVRAASRHGAAVPGVPVTDTILRTSGSAEQARYLDRDSLVAVQTPQVFRWDLLHPAHEWAAARGKSFTDDGSLVAARGTGPVVVAGEQANWKVTTDGDWQRASALLAGS